MKQQIIHMCSVLQKLTFNYFLIDWKVIVIFFYRTDVKYLIAGNIKYWELIDYMILSIFRF